VPRTAVLEPKEQTRARPASRWSVVLLDDDDHSYAYVVEMLGALFGHSRETAYEMAVEVDTIGRVVVWTGMRELAEHWQARVHAYGADPRIAACRGSMSAVIEPAL
jgi:ATP-dependent Clp protease adaptor protein ClpS